MLGKKIQRREEEMNSKNREILQMNNIELDRQRRRKTSK